MVETVSRRTQPGGESRLQLLLFRMADQQLYGINVFKVKEVLPCPTLSKMPDANPLVRGLMRSRDGAVPIVDLSLATAQSALATGDRDLVIVTQYNGASQGLLVREVKCIVSLGWEEVQSLPVGTGVDHYLTAVAEVEGALVNILDLERILAQVAPVNEDISTGLLPLEGVVTACPGQVLIVDDSAMARKQVGRCFETIGVATTLLSDGKQALEYLQALAERDEDVASTFLAMISDIEMPEMDGYTLTSAVRADPRLASLYVVLHSSLSGEFNHAMVKKVGADNFLPKFNPDNLAAIVVDRLKAQQAGV